MSGNRRADLVAALVLGPAARAAGVAAAEARRQEIQRLADARAAEMSRVWGVCRRHAFRLLKWYWLAAFLAVLFVSIDPFFVFGWEVLGKAALFASGISLAMYLAELLAGYLLTRASMAGEGREFREPTGSMAGRSGIAFVAMAIVVALFATGDGMALERWPLAVGVFGGVLLAMNCFQARALGNPKGSWILLAAACVWLLGGVVSGSFWVDASKSTWEERSGILKQAVKKSVGGKCRASSFTEGERDRVALTGRAWCGRSGMTVRVYEARSEEMLRKFSDSFDPPEATHTGGINMCDVRGNQVAWNGWRLPTNSGKSLAGPLRCYRRSGESVLELEAGTVSLVRSRNDRHIRDVELPNLLIRVTSRRKSPNRIDDWIGNLMRIPQRVKRAG